ncbi:5-methyltetrahydropteroyltriglutamate--homocysteine S-methyltransferase [Actinomyces sp. F1_1611]
MTTPFPSATIVGYPRIGAQRELKRAVEGFWAGRLDETELTEVARDLRLASYRRLAELGLTEDASIPASFSFYDQVLDTTWLLGALPPRFEGAAGLAGYFLLARGEGGTAPLEMTKWFNTNYHYLVPEIGPDTPISLAHTTPVDLFVEAREAGLVVRPQLVGPLTYLLLSKPAVEGYRPLDRLDEVTSVYAELLVRLAEAGAPWVQLDEPGLTSDNLGLSSAEIAGLAERVYQRLGSVAGRPQLLVTTPYGEATEGLSALAQTPVEAIHADLVHGQAPAPLADKTLVAGLISGRNIWRADLEAKLAWLQAQPGAVSVATSTSLQHVPYSVAGEEWDHPHLKSWLAFAEEKVAEVVTLARGRNGEDISAELAAASQALATRAADAGVKVPAIRQRTASLQPADREREDYSIRQAAQAEKLQLPLLPTTTIGSFPQTGEIRQARAAHARGELSTADYEDRLRQEIRDVIHLQEKLDIDVLVHGEPERNDMVQYFAELLDGFEVTKNGWVQSYGSRCTRPSILWGDVSRPEPMTVHWSTYAQSVTDRPVKGMLTGPVTILAWSFVRDDLALGEVADQVGLALRDEVSDLEAAGIGVIQVDEPALRELLPLRREDQDAYLEWSVGSFRVATSGVEAQTQIHTHLCYSEFGDVIDAIDALGADVTSLEAARSHMEVLPALEATGFSRQIGPGIYDIHSPRVPEVSELSELLSEAVAAVPADRLWVNPDCGLKTRTYAQVEPSLHNMVAAAKEVRAHQ